MTKRKGLSKKTRFEVFKRDQFKCQYCGGTPPAAVLEVDHVIPVCEGGDDSRDNLVTACFDCNRGKAGNSLSSVPTSLTDKMEQQQEADAQAKAYTRFVKARRKKHEADIDAVEEIFTSRFQDYTFTPKFRGDIRTAFLPRLVLPEIEDAMHMATSRINSAGPCLKYFCGICWSKIREQGNG